MSPERSVDRESLRDALERRHEAVCSCPFDGTDPDCNLTLSGAWLGAALAALPDSGERAAGCSEQPSMPGWCATHHAWFHPSDSGERAGLDVEAFHRAMEPILDDMDSNPSLVGYTIRIRAAWRNAWPRYATPTRDAQPAPDDVAGSGERHVHEGRWCLTCVDHGVELRAAAPTTEGPRKDAEERLRAALERCFTERTDCIHGEWDAVNGDDHFGEHLRAALGDSDEP